MKRLLICLVCVCAIFHTMIVFSEPEITANGESPEDNAFIIARAGIGYYFWQSRYFADFSQDPAYDHSVQPYLMKRFEIKARIFFLEGGAEYLTNRFRESTDFESEEQTREEQDPLARQLSAFAGLRLGTYSIKTDVVFRKFQGNITSNGQKLYTGTVAPLYYYPESGSPLALNKGDDVNWFTVYKQYEIKLVKGGSLSNYSWDLGFQYIEYESPAEMEIQIGHNDLFSATLPAVPQALMFTKSKIYNIIFGYHQRKFITESFVFEWYAPLIVGLTSMENQYMELKPQWSYPPTNFVASTYIQASLQYVTKHVKIEFGGDFNMMLSNIYNETTLSRDLPYRSLTDGTEQALPAGTDITVRSMKWEYFWGLYVRASAYF